MFTRDAGFVVLSQLLGEFFRDFFPRRTDLVTAGLRQNGFRAISVKSFLHEIVFMPFRIILCRCDQRIAVLVIERLCLKIKGADQRKTASQLPCFSLSFPHQRGCDPLTAIRFFHPQVIDRRGLPFVCSQNTPAQKPSFPIRDLIDEFFFLIAPGRRGKGVDDLPRLFINVIGVVFRARQYFVFHVRSSVNPD